MVKETRPLTGRQGSFLLALLLLWGTSACQPPSSSQRVAAEPTPSPILKTLAPNSPPQLQQLIEGAIEQVGVTKGYDPSYVNIEYPGGDVPIETGVCTDVLVRAFRKVGIDLQRQVHEDMERAWSEYPKKWGLSQPDANIDHRRVPNLMTLLKRQGKAVTITMNKDDYLPGDIVTWDLGNGVDHIGIVSNIWSESEKRCLIVHNIGAGTKVEDVLFAWRITGHYRYFN